MTLTKLLYSIRNIPARLRGARQELNLMGGLINAKAELSATILKKNGKRIDLGVISRLMVTTAGVTYLAQGFTGTTEPENFNYHASGTSGTAESIADVALGAEVATRVAGSQTNPSAGVYRTIAVIPYTASFAIVEHGIFSAPAAGTLLDRSVFAAINVVNGDSIQFTYNFTITAGG